MPSWNEVLDEINTSKRVDALDFVRRKYIRRLYDLTGRNVIAYYSGWLQKPGLANTSIIDDDKNGLMATIHGLDRNKGLDLILHTQGGDAAATESIVDYLRKMFGTDIRAIVPQLAMSAGTMIACSCNEIVMGKQSSLGPIDPQFGGIPAHGVIEEFQRAVREIQENEKTIPLWQAIVGKYHPSFIGECEKAIEWSSQMVTSWLETGMFRDYTDKSQRAEAVVKELNNHEGTMTHARHIPIEECKRIGLNVFALETNQELQDLVLTIHHAFMHTFAHSPAVKIIENHDEKAVIASHQAVAQIIQGPQFIPGRQFISVPQPVPQPMPTPNHGN